MTIKHIFFDFDGVLIDSEILYCKFATQALKEEYNYNLSQEDYAKNYSGQDLRESLRQMNIFKNEVEVESFATSVANKVKENKDNNIVAIKNAKEVIQQLPVPCSITSSGDSASIKRALKITGLDEVFKGQIFGGTDLGKLKPDPAVYLKALEVMGVDPNEVLVIEDTIYGIQAAKSAKITKVLGFTGGSHTYPSHSEKLLNTGAFETSNTLYRILELIKSL